MKTLMRFPWQWTLCLAVGATLAANAQVTTFTTNTTISFEDAAYDGQNIVVSNCTLTVDGPHAFASVRVVAGGALTHSHWPEGVFSNLLAVVNEPHTLAGTNVVTLIQSNILSGTIRVSDAGATVVYTNGADYLLSELGYGWTGLERTTNSSIPDGSTVLVSYDVWLGTHSEGLNLTVSGEVEVEAGTSINATGRGYGGNLGSGNGGEAGSPPSGGGAGHGGYGGLSSSNGAGGVSSAGLLDEPASLGSGGGAGVGGVGGAGGGSIRLNSNGRVTINGTVSANGMNGVNSRSGGGAGGSIWITANTLTGNGTISANGGNGEPIHGGGGGGGRISLAGSTNLFTGSITAHGGSGFQYGGAGTIYSRPGTAAPAWVVTVDNGGAPGAITPFNITSQPALEVKGGAVVAPMNIQYVATLLVESNSWLTCLPGAARIEMTVTSNAVLAAGGGVNLRGKGYASGLGPGAGGFYVSGPGGISSSGGGAGHAGHGGMGAATNLSRSGNYYGIANSPTTAGSGGGGSSSYPGGAGGGVLLLTVTGVLQLDGSILADGERPVANVAGGGSGGGVRLSAGTLTGTGLISANGGAAYLPNGGGGSGGRIAVNYNTNTFSGTIVAMGGTGFQNGAAGTIYLKDNSGSPPYVLVDNGGIPGTNTFLAVGSSPAPDLTLRGGAMATGLTGFRNLTLGSNTSLAVPGGAGTAISFSVAGDALLEQGAAISLDGLGFGYNQGSGAGRYSGSGYPYSSGGGGGHGGYGGNGVPATSPASGGNAYDSLSSPNQAGSGGGGTSSYPGGAGGGAMHLTVTGLLRLDGRISADGLPATTGGAGGGAGGSLWLTVGGFSGTGLLSANGGAGDLPNGGGGGGGRIAVTYQSNAFTGTISARGGLGYVAGGAGTVYLKANTSNIAQVVFDNGGLRGTNTQFSATGTTDLTVRGGAVASSSYYSTSLRSLFIGSNSWFNCGYSSYSPESWSVGSNVVIEAGGGISADGRAYQGASGGAGRYGRLSGGGGGSGGYGGYGSDGPASANGGLANALNLTRPTALGGGGGAAYSPIGTLESAGGGALSLTVNGLLQLDGVVSANGRPGTTNGSGGGAGGSLLLTVGGLAGSGTIAANGGSGDLPAGGGGGGGRIAVYWMSNDFSGTITARGGAGFVAGGAGTIYLKESRANFGHLTADNGGQRGTNTLLGQVSPPSDWTVQGGAIVMPYPTSSLLNLNVHSNSVVLVSNQTLTVTGNATVQAGAAMLADGLGNGPGAGPGAGSNFQTPKAGANHAGLGGFNATQTGYGTVTAPTAWGSGGGNGSGSSGVAPFGGAGGGAVKLNVSGRLILDGRISANGGDGALNSGGGSGGSVWLTVGTLAGAGTIAANGGAGNGTAGGGGGGRVAIQFSTNLFSGSVATLGGGGASVGGAGTVYWQQTGATNRWLVVDNGGRSRANSTPLFGLPGGLMLNVANGAVVHPQSTLPLLTALRVGPQGIVTSGGGQSRLELATLGDLTIEAGGSVSVDGKGFPRNGGDGAGGLLSGQGGGGGHGGAGGASALGAAGGVSCGTEIEPLDRGSGGGAGGLGGSDGGGAVRINVGGTLQLGGLLSANGNAGWQDDSGGGAGGSIWITASNLTGDGVMSAAGGDGELFNGGGGGGGRLAIYSPVNTFTGLVSVVGGLGANAGQAGTVFMSTNLPHFEIATHSPSGVVSNLVSEVDLTFSDIVNPNSVSVEDFVLHTPGGALDQKNLLASTIGLFTVRVSFPVQNAPGDYRLEVGLDIEGLFAQPLSQVYTGAFTVALPVITGSVTNAAGQGVTGVLVQPDGGLPASITDATGRYSVGVPLGWTGSVAPGHANHVFVPGTRTYTNVVETVANEDYLMVESIVPQLGSGAAGTNLWLGWPGIPGVTYQIHASTNLVDWYPWGEVLMGTNGPMQVVVPAVEPPATFFRLKASN